MSEDAPTKQKKLDPFSFISAINSVEKENLFKTYPSKEEVEKAYAPFIINRGLSYFSDTVLYANEVNQYPNLPKNAQFDFLRLSIRPRKRWSKWWKGMENPDIEIIKKVFKYSNEKAAALLNVLTEEQMQQLRNEVNLDQGGV
ncbi:clamp loader small subunit [Caulobacter phage Cr30]|uniref:clamp loader of DNA polymerase n=1 Tax=Caulobacter phage Cr30 TaxID=1357714 RepID=UPI0004A9B887|nr:clamp loader of DNA polymerase [Caulobacter phage Cr30]AGS81020.1 clamp loader small subunit [Caulobacter phage Cr30]